MPWTAEQHLWKSKAKEGHQLSRGGPSNRQKNDIKNCVTRYVVPCSVNFKIKWQLSRGGPSNRQKNDIKNCVTRYVVPCSVNFKIKWQAKTTGPKYC